MKANQSHKVALYGLSALGSGVGFVTQMLISGFWSSAYSDDVFYFSVNSAFYFLSLGLGSLFTEKMKRPPLAYLFTLVWLLSVWAGLSIPLLTFVIRHFENRLVAPILAVSVAGFLSGQIIPLAWRLRVPGMKISLASLFLTDYLAAIACSIVFSYYVLLAFGYGKTVVILAALGAAGTAYFAKRAGAFSFTGIMALVAAVVLPGPAFWFGRVTDKAPSQRTGSPQIARVVASKQSHYQKIVLTEEKGESLFAPGIPQHVLYLDGFVQFSSSDEQAYHACLANVPAMAAEFSDYTPKKALILGGGDGLAARNFLSMPRIQQIKVVEIDPEIVRLAKDEVAIRMYNLDALRHPKVSVAIADAFDWVRDEKDRYDLILIDFPPPKNISLARLYSAEFYRNVLKLLSPRGFVAIQAGPSFAIEDRSLQTLSRVATTIKTTLSAIGQPAYPYVNPRDNQAFLLVPANPTFDAGKFFAARGMSSGKSSPGVPCIHSAAWGEPSVSPNTLNTLGITNHMRRWYADAGRPVFYYRGNHAVFLTE